LRQKRSALCFKVSISGDYSTIAVTMGFFDLEVGVIS